MSDSSWLIFAYKVTTTTHKFVHLIVKKILLELALASSRLTVAKAQWFIHLSFNSTFKLANSILSDHQKVLTCFNDTDTLALLKIVFPYL